MLGVQEAHLKGNGMLHRIVDAFDRICKRRKLKVNAGKSKVMVFEKAGEQTIDFMGIDRLKHG